MKNQKGVSLIALIITIIVIIILAAIVMQSSTGTVDEANFAGFAQEMGDYTSAVTTTAASIKADAAVEGVIINDAQKNYMLANDIEAVNLVSGDKYYESKGKKVLGFMVPAETGNKYKMNGTILLSLGYDVAADQDEIPAYVIQDEDKALIDGYKANFDMYGDSNGKETHYVTSDGTVFTLPGFPQTQENRSIRYYITPTAYYTVKGQSDEDASTDYSTRIVENPIQAAYLEEFDAVSADSTNP